MLWAPGLLHIMVMLQIDNIVSNEKVRFILFSHLKWSDTPSAKFFDILFKMIKATDRATDQRSRVNFQFFKVPIFEQK